MFTITQALPTKLGGIRAFLLTAALCLVADASFLLGLEALKAHSKALLKASREGHKDILEQILSHNDNVNPNARNTDDLAMTGLMMASANGHESCVQLLLDYGANPELVDEEGWPALAFAAKHGHANCVKLLEQATAWACDRCAYANWGLVTTCGKCGSSKQPEGKAMKPDSPEDDICSLCVGDGCQESTTWWKCGKCLNPDCGNPKRISRTKCRCGGGWASQAHPICQSCANKTLNMKVICDHQHYFENWRNQREAQNCKLCNGTWEKLHPNCPFCRAHPITCKCQECIASLSQNGLNPLAKEFTMGG